MSKEAKILTAILIVVVGAMIGVFALANKPDNTPAPKGDASKIIRDNSHKTGSGSVQLVEFGDYQCPACGAAYPNVKQLMKDYNGKVTLYFRNFPLTQIHQNAMLGAEAAEAAGDQGKYWEMHDKLYENQKDWGELNGTDAESKIVGYAKDLGLDTDKFKKAIDDEQFKQVIAQDMADGNALGINATPTFYLNGTQLQGGYDYATLRDAVNAALKQ
ncbi:MAG TPA: thioredoxin domain-containing protein [Candidatus Saccharimonadia bacterium]